MQEAISREGICDQKNTYGRNTWHQQGGNKGSENTPLSPIVQTVPPEHVEIARPVHVTGVDLSGERVDEIIINKHLIPCVDEIHINIICDLQVTVHPEEALERAIDRIVECGAVETIERPSFSEEVLIISGSQVGGSKETGGQLRSGLTPATVEMSKGLPASQRKGTHRYREPNVFPPVTSQVMNELFFPSAAVQVCTPEAHLIIASTIT